MDLRYLGFAKRDSPFYSNQGSEVQRSVLRPMNLPASWVQGASGPWRTWAPLDVELRQQGWKIHVSATPGNAAEILETVGRICVEGRIPFKFIDTIEQLITRNSKSADRSASGKFITIYPHDDEQLAVLADQLERAVGGMPGPFILSDVRYRQGPVYFRYGGFRPLQKLDDSHGDASWLVAPDGELVEDERVPVFRSPAWAHVPPVVAESIAVQRAPAEPSRLDEYASLTALHFSNSGGVYRVTAEDGTVSILKEARPLAGLDRSGRDATARLERETANLTALEQTGIAPRVLRTFQVWEHCFLEMEHIEGETLKRWNVQNHPFSARASAESIEAYTAQLVQILTKVRDAVDLVHAQNLVVGDLHPSNILLLPDRSIRLIDLEDGRAPADRDPAPFNAFGYEVPDGITAAQADWYGFARLVASSFYIASAIEILAPAYRWNVLRWIQDRFGSPASSLLLEAQKRAGIQVTATLFTPETTVIPWSPEPAGIPQRSVRDLIAEGILATGRNRGDAQPRFPGDIRQWDEHGQLDVATGVAGILLSLRRAGVNVPTGILDDLGRTAANEYRRMPPGLFHGIAGVASVLQEHGRTALSERLFDHLMRNLSTIRDVDLSDGLAGVGLALLRSGAAGEQRAQQSVAIADVIIGRVLTNPAAGLIESLDNAGGLLHGWSGVALFLAEVAAHTQEERYLAAARRALDADLARTVSTSDGALHALDPDGSRSFPYLARGTAGMLIPMTLISALDRSPAAYEVPRAGILAACDSREYAFSGLFRGRAGIVASLAYGQESPEIAEILAGQLPHLSEHALSWDGHLLFPGDNYLRLSTDLSTGSAGVLAALVAAEQPRSMPWLPVVALAPSALAGAAESGEVPGRRSGPCHETEEGRNAEDRRGEHHPQLQDQQ